MKSAGDVEVVGKCVTSCIVGLWVRCWKGVGKVLEAPLINSIYRRSLPGGLSMPYPCSFNALSIAGKLVMHLSMT